MTRGIKLISLFFPILILGQSRVGEWKSYPSFLNVRETIEVGDLLVSATSGGILLYDREAVSFETVTNIDGLVETDLSVIAEDGNGHLWLGGAAPNGTVQIYDLAKRQSVKIFNFDLWEVTSFAVSDSVVCAAYSKDGQWGILEFVMKDGEFSYRQIYNPSDESLESISGLALRGDFLFAATDLGLFSGDYKKFILNYPQNWTSISEFAGKSMTRLRHMGDELLAIADGEIWSVGTEPQLLSDIYSSQTYLRDVNRDASGTVTLLTKWKLVRLDASGKVENSWDVRHEPSSFTPTADGNFTISSSSGIAIWKPDREKFEWRTPNSPASNVYTAMIVLEDGRLVAAGPDGIAVLN